MTFTRASKNSAFTLIELLTVIAIIAILAGLLIGLNNVAGEKARISRAMAERDKLVTLIEAYRLKLGVVPPANPNVPGKNTLLYELAGAIRNTNSPYSPANPNYETPFGSIRGSDLITEFGIGGIINSYAFNSVDDATEFKRFLKNLKPNQYTTNGNVLGLTIAIDDPNRNQPNYWNYRVGTNNAGAVVHNPESFDLWVEIYKRGKTNVGICTNCIVIGNWKD